MNVLVMHGYCVSYMYSTVTMHFNPRAPRLQGEKTVADFIHRVQLYVERKFGDSRPDLLCRIYIRTIEHAYYKARIA